MSAGKQETEETEYRCTFFLGGGFVKIERGEVEVYMRERNLTRDEMAVAAMINEAISRLKNGKLVKYDFDFRSLEDTQGIVKCEWLRSGNLKVHGPVNKVYMHCLTIQDVMAAHRTFTCPKALLGLLPKRRTQLPFPLIREVPDSVSTGNK